MKRLVLLMLAFFASIGMRADDATILAGVKAADDARVAAMVAADAKQLDAILSDDLYYGHSSKLVENKAEHIASLTTRRLVYRKMDFQSRDFSLVAPGVALAKGRALVEVGSILTIFLVDINFLAVWRLENQRWRLQAWQSCRNADPVPLAPPTDGK